MVFLLFSGRSISKGAIMETTLVIIKPDAIERGLIGRIIQRFEDKYLRITGIALLKKDDTWYKKMYGHVPEDVFKNMKEFLSNPLIGLTIVGEGAVEQVKAIVGKDIPYPGTIRGDFGLENMYNCVHCSDSATQAEKEINWFFYE